MPIRRTAMLLTILSASAAIAQAPPPPAYEVATIKPVDANGFALPLRVYIQSAFGIPANSTGWVIGPDWINSARYAIQGKPPDSIRDAMQTMSAAERNKETHLMQQALLADRFKLKAHFETREMPVYFSLKWTPMDATNGTDTQGATLFTAIEEQLGLKLVPTKGPGQVLVIDHIEKPSEN